MMDKFEDTKGKIKALLQEYSPDKGDQIGLLDEIVDEVEFEFKFDNDGRIN